ncbi:MAG: hypothetical protein WB777_14145 [Mycobacterium sp.]
MHVAELEWWSEFFGQTPKPSQLVALITPLPEPVPERWTRRRGPILANGALYCVCVQPESLIQFNYEGDERCAACGGFTMSLFRAIAR